MGALRKEYIIGFLFTLGFVGYMMAVGFPNPEYRLTDADIELMNVMTFARFSLDVLSEEAYHSLLLHELRTAVDREALDTLVSLGVPELHAQFVCNYFLAQNLEYPGELIVLSSQTPLYSHGFLLPQDTTGFEIYEFWEKSYHDIIEEKQPYDRFEIVETDSDSD